MNSDIHSDCGLGDLQQEVLNWIEKQLPKLPRYSVYSTYWYGVMGKACSYAEAVINQCLKIMLIASGDKGDMIVQKVGNGKPLARFTLGQSIQTIRQLDFLNDTDLLDKISPMRNDFAHRRWEDEQGNALTQEFLLLIKELCQSELLTIAIQLEKDNQIDSAI